MGENRRDKKDGLDYRGRLGKGCDWVKRGSGRKKGCQKMRRVEKGKGEKGGFKGKKKV